MKTSDMFINELKTSEALQKLLADAAKNNALDAFLKEQGVDATAEAFIAALKAQAEQLDDDALDAVAGGVNMHETMLSILTAGVGCAVVAVISAAESGVGDGPNDQLLCNNEYSKEIIL